MSFRCLLVWPILLRSQLYFCTLTPLSFFCLYSSILIMLYWCVFPPHVSFLGFVELFETVDWSFFQFWKNLTNYLLNIPSALFSFLYLLNFNNMCICSFNYVTLVSFILFYFIFLFASVYIFSVAVLSLSSLILSSVMSKLLSVSNNEFWFQTFCFFLVLEYTFDLLYRL